MTHSHPRTPPSPVTWAACASAAVLLLSSCSQGAPPGIETNTDADQVIDDETLADMQAQVEEHAAQPEFEPAGEAFSVADLEGKKILSMPVNSQLEGCDSMARESVEIAESLGMEGTYFQNDGTTTAWAQGMNTAINQDYDGVILVCGINPDEIAPQIETARDDGLEVVVTHLSDMEDEPNELVSAQTSGQFNLSMRLGVYSAFVENEGRPFDVLMLTSHENPPSHGMEETVRDEMEEHCGEECSVESVNVAMTNYATDLTGAVSSALVANPDISAVFMAYDAMTPFVIPAVQSAPQEAYTYAFGADPTFLEMMQEEDTPQRTDMGPNFDWMSYTGMDQLFRAMAGEDVIPAAEAYSPYRLWTPEVADELVPPDYGFGDSYIWGYRDLWLDAPEWDGPESEDEGEDEEGDDGSDGDDGEGDEDS